MPFVVFDQGVRIVTPAISVFPPATVKPVASSTAVAAIQAHDRGAVPVHRDSVTLRQSARGMSDYQQHKEPDSRSAVFKAGEVMTRQLTTLRFDDVVATAWQLFQQHTFHHIPVTDGKGRLQGMLSDRDVWLRLADWQAFQKLQSVSQIMQQRVVCATADTDIRMLASAMAQNQIGAVPILADEDNLLGIVTRTDILRLVMTQPKFQLWL